MPEDITGLRKGLIDFLSGQGYESAISGLPRGGDLSPFMQLFQQQLAPVLGQAKEQAGTLTGSGFANILGSTAGRSTSDFLLSLLNQRANRFANLLGGLATGGVSATPTYQPGFLDYLFSAAGKAAPYYVASKGLTPGTSTGGPGAFGVDSVVPAAAGGGVLV